MEMPAVCPIFQHTAWWPLHRDWAVLGGSPAGRHSRPPPSRGAGAAGEAPSGNAFPLPDHWTIMQNDSS